MSVAMYAEKLEDMVAYSRQVVYAPEEKWKIDQFLFGLRGEISHSISQREFTTYAELLRQCYVTENSLKKIQEERDQYRIRQKDHGRSVCKKSHFGRCAGSVIRCFTCQREGHVAKDYPRNKNRMQGRNIGRVYTLDARKAKSNNALIVGTCLINDHPCFVLFDCGETHSFVSIQCMKRLDLQEIPLSPPMMVNTGMDDVVETPLICENCSLSVNGRIFKIDLICLPLKKVDVILGIDWLSPNLVFIEYEEKLIIIQSSESTPNDIENIVRYI
ncbi:uncharacterized protein LOC127093617 [Lathyrus oleraceus]|uniref:uncharacterized protein LOC127093617 n=1 Tax=Pisum sativum TaxID=3888 RepID=UPI0021CF5961|nr:uncharacterized protein LOC127093617 [Pisum sativum]